MFTANYRVPNQLPRELQRQTAFPSGNAGELGWASKHQQVRRPNGSTEAWVWIVVPEGGVVRRGWIPVGPLRPGNARRDVIPINILAAANIQAPG